MMADLFFYLIPVYLSCGCGKEEWEGGCFHPPSVFSLSSEGLDKLWSLDG